MDDFDEGYLPKLLIDQILWYFLQPCIVIVPSVEDVVSGNKWPIHIFSIVDDMSALLYNLLHLFFHNCNHSCLFGPQWKYTLVKARA